MSVSCPVLERFSLIVRTVRHKQHPPPTPEQLNWRVRERGGGWYWQVAAWLL
jgi:hypothetical protein